MEEDQTMQDSPEPNVDERRSWHQIPQELCCPVIGTCLTMDEQREIVKKAKVSVNGLKDIGDHDVHGLLVQSGRSDCPLSRRVQRYLDRKYRSEIREWGLCPEEELLTRWDQALKGGDIGAALWIAASHPQLPADTTKTIFGDVHLWMHEQAWLVRQKHQQIDTLRTQGRQLKDRLHKTQARHREARQALHEFEGQCEQLERELAAARRSQTQDEEAASSQVQIAKAECRIETQAQVIERLQADNEQLTAELESAGRLNRAMQAELQEMLRELRRNDESCEICPNRYLCEKRILLVGGMTRLRATYQVLIEDMGGEFKHHDGRSQGGSRMLEGMISWADVVLCPVDVNSHSACLGVKKTCKRLNKPYHMLPGSGVTNVARALTEYCQPAG